MLESPHKRFDYKGVAYGWSGGLGTIFTSIEKGEFKLGDTRIISDRLFYIYHLERYSYSKYIIGWGLVNSDCTTNITIEDIRKLKAEIFGCT